MFNKSNQAHAAPCISNMTYRNAGQLLTQSIDNVDAHHLTLKNVQAIIELENQARASATWGERASVFVSRLFGNIFFVCFQVAVFGGWIVANGVPLLNPPLDPFPFTFLTLVVALESIFLTVFILISQTHENGHTQRQTRLNLQISMLTEQENTKMLLMLQSIAAKVGADLPDDPEIRGLSQATHPAHVAAQIDSVTHDSLKSPS